MIVYKAERDANLAEMIQANCSVAYNAQVSLANAVDSGKLLNVDEDKLKKILASSGQTGGSAECLHPLNTIMVSTGWNLNDDVFERVEMWAARNTPEDMPLNFEHKCSDIIGHIIGCNPVDTDYKIIEETKDGVILAVEDLPEKYHILTSAVLYKVWSDSKLQERMDKIIAEIPKGEWFVSMEALFSNYDYAIITPAGKQVVIARNEETAFLTKHLRAYGGTGRYKDNRVGRVVRNITFCGKGLVRKPANPDSIIFAKPSEVFVGKTFASYEQFLDNSTTMGYINNVTGSNQPRQESIQMSVTVEQLQAQLDSAKKQVDSLVAENATLKNETTEKLKAQVATLATDVKSRDEQLTAKANELAELNKKLEASEKSVKSATEELATVKAELGKVQAAELKTNRISSLVSAGVEKAEAEELFDMTSAMDAEKFTKFVAKTKAIKDAAVAAAKTQPEAPKTPETKTEATVKAEDLNSAKPNTEPALATSGVNTDKVEEVRKNIFAAYTAHKTSPNKTEKK